MLGFWSLLLLVPTLAKVSTGRFYSDNNQWALIDSFCADSTGGEVKLTQFSHSVYYPNQTIAVYHDLDDVVGGFPQLYKQHSSCQSKVAQAAKSFDLSRLEDDEGIVLIPTTVVPRWWYVVVANCEIGGPHGEGVGLINYNITWTNTNNGEISRFTYHFSKDQEGMFEMSIFSLIMLILLIPCAVFLYCRLKKDESDLAHKVVGLVLAALTVHFFAVVFKIAHYDAYSYDGMGVPGVDDFAIVLDAIRELILVFMFIIVSKGMFISSETLRGMRAVLEVMFLYLCATIGLLYWAYSEIDPALQMYAYQSDAGVCLVLLRVLTLFWFLSSLQTSWRRERQQFKRTFYICFAVFGMLWFLILPITVVVAELLDSWHRKKTVYILEQLFAFITYIGWMAIFGKNSSYVRKATGETDALDNGENDRLPSHSTV